MAFSPSITKTHDEVGNYAQDCNNKKKEKIDHGCTLYCKAIILKLEKKQEP